MVDDGDDTDNDYSDIEGDTLIAKVKAKPDASAKEKAHLAKIESIMTQLHALEG